MVLHLASRVTKSIALGYQTFSVVSLVLETWSYYLKLPLNLHSPALPQIHDSFVRNYHFRLEILAKRKNRKTNRVVGCHVLLFFIVSTCSPRSLARTW